MPQNIIGKRIICREALIQGPVSVQINESFWEMRSEFICINYNVDLAYYHEKSKEELLKIPKANRDAHIYLWFEHDAFCQVHLFFVANLLVERKFSGKAFLVVPNRENTQDKWQGFAHHNEELLEKCFVKRILLAPSEMKILAQCWSFFAEKNWKSLAKKYHDLKNILPFVDDVSEALAIMNEQQGELCYLENALKHIQKELKTDNFNEVFNQFTLKYGIYGLADLQVKYILENMPKANSTISNKEIKL